MCGIAGFIGSGDQEDLARMTQALLHRGPDAYGYWHDEAKAVYLGHRRLSVIDLQGGEQPMWDATRQVGVVFNGEIYNHQALRKELEEKGYVFQTKHSDTEVLLYGYLAWGTAFTVKLNGMWAFALYDRKQKIIFCSRDRFGKKPFFYTHQAGLFAFASELTALAQHSHIHTTLSTLALQKYFAYGHIPAPHSLYEGIFKLPAGHSLIFNLAQCSITVSKYWDFVLEPFEQRPANAEEQWCEQIRALLDNAVKRRLPSDVPLGSFLSGGVDSSAIVALATRHVTTGSLDTFCIGFQEAAFNESHYARQVATTLQTHHHEQILSLDAAKSLLPAIVNGLDEPIGDSSLLPTYQLCQFAKKHVTVALSGDGADELFAGYAPFRALQRAEQYQKWIPKPIHQAIRALFERLPVSHNYLSLDFKIKRTLRGLSYPAHLWNPVWLGPLEKNELEELFATPIDIEELYSEAISTWDHCKQTNIIDKTLQFYTKIFLQDGILVKLDRASMMNSLEVRSPFLDIELVDFIRKIPSEYKFRNGETKYILKKSLEPVLANDILYRKKQGFAMPIGKWLKEKQFSFDAEIATLNPQFTQNKLQEHIQNKHDHRLYLWNQWLLSQVAKTN